MREREREREREMEYYSAIKKNEIMPFVAMDGARDYHIE